MFVMLCYVMWLMVMMFKIMMIMTNHRKASADVLKLEQQNDKSLANCWAIMYYSLKNS